MVDLRLPDDDSTLARFCPSRSFRALVDSLSFVSEGLRALFGSGLKTGR